MPDSVAQSSPVQSSPVQALQDAAQGLLFPSETDAPLIPFFWPQDGAQKITPEIVAQCAQLPADSPIKSVSIEKFFAPATQAESWHNDEEKAQVRRFQGLLEAIKTTLKDAKVFRVGETNIDVYIVGNVEGGLAGLQTKVVET